MSPVPISQVHFIRKGLKTHAGNSTHPYNLPSSLSLGKNPRLTQPTPNTLVAWGLPLSNNWLLLPTQTDPQFLHSGCPSLCRNPRLTSPATLTHTTFMRTMCPKFALQTPSGFYSSVKYPRPNTANSTYFLSPLFCHLNTSTSYPSHI